MARTVAEDRAIKKYEQEKIDKVLDRFPKGKKEQIQRHVANTGESLNGFINRAVDQALSADDEKK